MTYIELKKILKRNKIPNNVYFMSDSGWEGDATDMDGVYYNKGKNMIVFTQYFSEYETEYTRKNGWKKLL